MSFTEMMLQKIQALPPEKQREVLEYVERIGTAPSKAGPRLDPEGALAEQPSGLDFDDFEKARRALWGDTPPEDI